MAKTNLPRKQEKLLGLLDDRVPKFCFPLPVHTYACMCVRLAAIYKFSLPKVETLVVRLNI